MSARRGWHLAVSVAGTTVAGRLLVGCGTGTTVLEAAAEECGVSGIGDDGRSLTLDMKGEEPGTGSLSIDDVVCVLAELDVPDSVVTKMDSTTSLDGRQEDEWSGIEASWKYHPDNGLDVVLELG